MIVQYRRIIYLSYDMALEIFYLHLAFSTLLRMVYYIHASGINHQHKFIFLNVIMANDSIYRPRENRGASFSIVRLKWQHYNICNYPALAGEGLSQETFSRHTSGGGPTLSFRAFHFLYYIKIETYSIKIQTLLQINIHKCNFKVFYAIGEKCMREVLFSIIYP